MGVRVDVEAIVTGLDGSYIAHERRIAGTFNIDPEKVEHEVPLALARLDAHYQSIRDDVERQLTDWSTQQRSRLDKAKAAQEAAQEGARRVVEDDEGPDGFGPG